MATELRKCNKLSWALCDGDCDKCKTFATTETVYNRYTDTAGNYHWTGAYSGEHIIKMNNEETMTRYIDANKNSMFVKDKIYKELPTVDVVEVVRCKDCKYYNPQHHYCEGIGNWFGIEGEWGDNGYCYKGERREDGAL